MTKDLPEHLDYDSQEAILDYLDELNEKKLYAGHILEDADQICQHVAYNRKLVVLDRQSYPDEIFNVMNKYADYYDTHKPCIDMPKVESLLIADKNSITSILDEI